MTRPQVSDAAPHTSGEVFDDWFTPERLAELERRFRLPLHIVFPEGIASAARRFRNVFARHYPDGEICFAVKSNPCRGAIRTARRLDLGIDAVSEYELEAALEEGVPPGRIICNGNAKSDDYLRQAVLCGAIIAVDGDDELATLLEIVRQVSASKPIPILLRVVGMPLEGLTAADQTTASDWTKFGWPVRQIRNVIRCVDDLPEFDLAGLSAHIGTQICDPAGYDRLMDNLLPLVKERAATGRPFRMLDIGGGFPVNYLSGEEWVRFKERLRAQLLTGATASDAVTWDHNPMGYGWLMGQPPDDTSPWRGKAYSSPAPGAEMLEHILARDVAGRTVAQHLKEGGKPRLIVEPGRSLFGEAGVTIARAMGSKDVLGNRVVILDLGIVNHGTVLVTPDIHPYEVLPHRPDDQPVEAFVAGRLCFSGDMISKVKVPLNRLPERGDVVVIHKTGAYCADHFASRSCGFPLPAKIALTPDETVEVWREETGRL
ncbi:MAG: hypothetical protein FJY67_07940 [Calditrichaeota bacterium]|nr:hypothetical protein [Calditrichota bacterium]